MLIKAIALSLALIFGIGVIIPLTTNDAEAGAHKHRKHHKRYKKYSKGWWRQYHKHMRRKQEARARWRRERLRQMRTAAVVNRGIMTGEDTQSGAVREKTVADTAPAVLPTGDAAPKNWKKAQNTPSEMQFRVDNDQGSQVGAAAITVVGPSTGADNETARVKTLGGVPTTSLRRTVIDRMIRENGWVVNDFQKDLDGKKVYVVVAQSQGAGGKMQSRMFYFTESDGRIYSVATIAPADAADKLAEETEKVVNSLQKHSQQAGLK